MHHSELVCSHLDYLSIHLCYIMIFFNGFNFARFHVKVCYLLDKRRICNSSVGLSICLSVRKEHHSKSYEQIVMKLYGGVLGPGWYNKEMIKV